MHTWQLWHSNAGYEVELTETPWWALALSRTVEVVDVATRHRLCGAGTPNWLGRIPLGRPVYEHLDDGEIILTNSLAGWFSDVFVWAACADIVRARSLHRFAASDELARSLGSEDFGATGTSEDLAAN